MRRKIIKQGSGAHTIILPVQWVRKHHLHPGDEVMLKENDDVLMIVGHGNEGEKKKIISLPEIVNKDYLRTVIASAYKAGYTEIVLQIDKMPPVHLIN